VQNFAGLVTTRIFLGFFEGCLFPSMTLFLCNWYTREELGIRVAYLFIASALSGAFGGLIAFGILYMDGVAGWAGWRWLYVLEGIVTIFWAACCIWLVPKSFETAYFLNEEEKQIMRQRAARTQAYSDSAGSGHYGRSDIKEAAKDIKSWLHGCIQIAVVTILYGFGTFLPIIIRNGFHYSVKQVCCNRLSALDTTLSSSRRNTLSFQSICGVRSFMQSVHTCPIDTRLAFSLSSSWRQLV
jgi:MFS family permease